MLLWTCQQCGWQRTVAAPGFAGDGLNHYPDGQTACGPITAQRDVHFWSPVDPTANATDEHECVFVEEQEPSGRLILPPCIVCGTTAMDALHFMQNGGEAS